MRTTLELPETLAIPGVEERLRLRLPPEIAALRERALAFHQGGAAAAQVPELTLSDARSWAAHTPAEDWLLWRARRCAARLTVLPLDLEPGERLVGKPRLRLPLDSEQPALEQAQRLLASMPPFPGGDSGHFHPDYDKLFRVGLGGLLQEIESRRQEAAGDLDKATFYAACALALQGMIAYVRRVAEACQDMARSNTPDARRWQALADICRHVPPSRPVPSTRPSSSWP